MLFSWLHSFSPCHLTGSTSHQPSFLVLALTLLLFPTHIIFFRSFSHSLCFVSTSPTPYSQTCSNSSTGAITSADDLSWNVWFFFVAQLLHGAGAAPLFTLGVTFIDENVSKKMSSVYLGTTLHGSSLAIHRFIGTTKPMHPAQFVAIIPFVPAHISHFSSKLF